MARPRPSAALAFLGGLLALAALAGCGGSAPAARPPADAPAPLPEPAPPPPAPETVPPAPSALAPDVVRAFVVEAVRTDGALTRADVTARLGAPRRVEREAVPNPHDARVTDTLRTAVYDGLRVQTYEATRPAKSLLIRVVVTAPRYASPEGLRVGDARAAVLRRLGPPTERDPAPGGGEALVYMESGPTPTALIVTTDGAQGDARVTALEWQFYFG